MRTARFSNGGGGPNSLHADPLEADSSLWIDKHLWKHYLCYKYLTSLRVVFLYASWFFSTLPYRWILMLVVDFSCPVVVASHGRFHFNITHKNCSKYWITVFSNSKNRTNRARIENQIGNERQKEKGKYLDCLSPCIRHFTKNTINSELIYFG